MPPLPPAPPWRPSIRVEIEDTLRADPWIAGILLDFAATLAGTLGKHLFRLGALNAPDGCRWYTIGVLLAVVVDPVLDMLAFSMSSQTIVSACVGFVVMWNVLLAPTLLGERLTRLRVIACILILIGTVLVGVFGPHEERTRSEEEYFALLGSPSALVYLFIISNFVAFAWWRWSQTGAHARIWGAILGGSLAGNNFAVKYAPVTPAEAARHIVSAQHSCARARPPDHPALLADLLRPMRVADASSRSSRAPS